MRFASFVSLVGAFAAVEPKGVGHTNNNRSLQGSKYAQILEKWVEKLREEHSPLPSTLVATFFRLFFPEEDVSRKYGLQETRLAGYIADILNVSTAQDTRGWSLRSWNTDGTAGCLGTEVENLLASTSQASDHTANSCCIY